MAVGFSNINKPLNPRGNDASPKGYNRAALYSGKALDFDGVNDSVTTSSNLDISNGSDLSYVSYFKTTETTAGYLFENNAFYVAIRRDDFNDGGTRIGKISSFISSSWLDTDLVVNDDHWHQCAMTLSNGTQKIYIDGQEIASATGKSYNNSGQAAPQIGVRDSGFYFDGQIANTRVFNVGLTAAQVSDLYNNPEKIVPTGVADSALKLWLPMMEGAGTTAYDGSGNGNHGTISGATWTHGIGAPVAQTAVIDWNKGRNMTHYSEDGTQWNLGGNTPTLTQDQADPFGGTRAQRVTMDASGTFAQIYKEHNQINASAEYTAKMWLKAVSGTPTIGINYNQGTWHQVTLTNEWAEYEVTRIMNANYSFSHNIYIGSSASGTSSTADFYIYGLQIRLGDTAGPYVPTFGTAQTSDVLLPQGLTSGRDITGVNLFENVRKQGALNLDGNSWAEVHDNASLDFSSGMSLEAWFQIEANSFGRHVLGKWNFPANKREYLIYWNGTTNKIECYFGNAAAAQSANVSVTPTGQWVHFVGTTDGSTITPYLNGVAGTTAAQTTSLGDSDINVKIGTDDTNTGAQYRMNTPIAQPRIYNRALTASEVLRNYNSGKSTYQ